MNKNKMKNIFKNNQTKWEQKPMHDFIDLLTDKSMIVVGVDEAYTKTHSRYIYEPIKYGKVLQQKGDGLSLVGGSVRVDKAGFYLIISTTVMKGDVFGDYLTAVQTRTGNALSGSWVYMDSDRTQTVSSHYASHLNVGDPVNILTRYDGGRQSEITIGAKSTLIVIQVA